MNWADSAAAAATIEFAEGTQWETAKSVPVRLSEIATRIFALDWLMPDGTRVHQVIDFRHGQPLATLELDGAKPPAPGATGESPHPSDVIDR